MFVINIKKLNRKKLIERYPKDLLWKPQNIIERNQRPVQMERYTMFMDRKAIILWRCRLPRLISPVRICNSNANSEGFYVEMDKLTLEVWSIWKCKRLTVAKAAFKNKTGALTQLDVKCDCKALINDSAVLTLVSQMDQRNGIGYSETDSHLFIWSPFHDRGDTAEQYRKDSVCDQWWVAGIIHICPQT